MAVAAKILRIEGPKPALSGGNVAQDFKLLDLGTDGTIVLHVEVAEADKDDAEAWKTALEAISPGYALSDWS